MQLEAAHLGWAPSQRVRARILIGLSIAAVIGVMLHAPIAQPLDYHAFVDQRAIWGIPNFWNVISNVPFLIFGLMGTVEIARRKSLPLKWIYLTFFAGTGVVAVGSVVYWHVTEVAGGGDLRPYIVTQFLPIILIPIMLLLYPSRLWSARLLWAVLGTYVLAKIL